MAATMSAWEGRSGRLPFLQSFLGDLGRFGDGLALLVVPSVLLQDEIPHVPSLDLGMVSVRLHVVYTVSSRTAVDEVAPGDPVREVVSYVICMMTATYTVLRFIGFLLSGIRPSVRRVCRATSLSFISVLPVVAGLCMTGLILGNGVRYGCYSSLLDPCPMAACPMYCLVPSLNEDHSSWRRAWDRPGCIRIASHVLSQAIR